MKCAVCVIHLGSDVATWRDKTSPSLVVCDRHKQQYEERPDLGPYSWEAIDADGMAS